MNELLDCTLDNPGEPAPDDAHDAPAAGPFAPGATIGHFRLVRQLGAGGMGVVFEAYDPDLDRRVAIKVVRGAEADSAAGVRLIREAQAMARLTHPNVVGVHEVGTIEGQVFVVMELVRGETLATWLDERRPWRAIVELFVQAGDGLVAAHHAGLIHRDFKPSNVLVDPSGRVRVSDFGLARSDDEPRFPRGSDQVGTPAFMAPEQRDGQPIDARADQYAFAMSLQHALDPRRAFGTAPRRVRAAIARGLAIDPGQRFPTLDALLIELRRALRTRRRRGLVLGITGAAAAAAVISWSLQRSEDHCADGARLADDVWDGGQRAALIRRFTELRPQAEIAIASTTALIDDWAAAWKLGRRAACKAEPAQRAPRLACLDRHLHDLRAQLAVWHQSGGEAVDRAVATASALPQIDLCASPKPPVTVGSAIADRLSALSALEHAGRARDAEAEMPAVLQLAEISKDPGELGAALLVAGRVAYATGDLGRARDLLVRAASESARAGRDPEMIEALLIQASVVVDQGRPLDSLGLLDAANAVIARTGLDQAARYALARGDALTQAGKVDEGIAELTRAVGLFEDRSRRDPSQRLMHARALGALAAAHNARYEWTTAYELLSRTLAIEESALGPMHPEVGKTVHDLATNANRLGRYDEAMAGLERARAIFVAAYGERHTLVSSTDISLANGALQSGHADAARTYYERARRTSLELMSADHPNIAIIESGLGTIERQRDRCADALPHFERAVSIYERAGQQGPLLASSMINLGACLADVGRDAEAHAQLVRALELAEQTHMADRDRAEAWTLLADLEFKAGHRARAIELAHKVLASTTDEDGPAWAELRSYVREEQLGRWTRAR
ncbi:MAG: protein kinase domain-containing protein [Kofleriaceae bacterium]